MPYCTNCGRKLEDNEVCLCKKSTNPPPQNQQFNQPPPNLQFACTNAQGQPLYDELGRPLFSVNGEPVTYDANGNPKVKKNNSGCIVAIVIAIVLFLFFGGIFAAILIPAMVGYTGRAKVQNANAAARTIHHAATSTIEEMDEMGYDVGGTYMISSDKSENIHCENINTDYFYDTFGAYAKEYLHKDWHIIVEDGRAVYSAIDNDDCVGTYPSGSRHTDEIPIYNGDYVHEDADYDEIFFANANIVSSIPQEQKNSTSSSEYSESEKRSRADRSKLIIMTAEAESFVNIANAALTKLKVNGYQTEGTYLLASDESMNFQCEDIDTDRFYDFFEDSTGNDGYSQWFIVVVDGTAKYSAIESDGFVVTYPDAEYYGINPATDMPLYDGADIPADSSFDDVYAANKLELAGANR